MVATKEKRKKPPESSPLSHALSPTEFVVKLLGGGNALPTLTSPKSTPAPTPARIAAYATPAVRAAQAVDACAALGVLAERGELVADACNPFGVTLLHKACRGQGGERASAGDGLNQAKMRQCLARLGMPWEDVDARFRYGSLVLAHESERELHVRATQHAASQVWWRPLGAVRGAARAARHQPLDRARVGRRSRRCGACCPACGEWRGRRCWHCQ